MPRYTIHSFTAGNDSDDDLSAFFNTPGIADPHQQNSQWQLIEVSGDAQQWTGDVDPDGSLVPGPLTPPDLHFIDHQPCTGFMEIQVELDESPQCPIPEPPMPFVGAVGTANGGDGGCGIGTCGGGGQIV